MVARPDVVGFGFPGFEFDLSGIILCECGNGVCEPGEDSANCSMDCGGPCDLHGGDTDGDGFCDTGPDGPCTGSNTTDCSDNCVTIGNADQADGDGDAVGDACDNCV
ncbi:MAG: hypothetical protein ACE5FG_12385, partial [Myxococcota bacterium]